MRSIDSVRRTLVHSTVLTAAALIVALPALAQQQLPRPGQLPPPGQPQGQMQMQQRPAAPPQGQMQPPPQQQQRQPAQGQMQPPPQQQQQPAQAPIKPYKMIAVGMPQPLNDPSFEAFRKQLADIATK